MKQNVLTKIMRTDEYESYVILIFILCINMFFLLIQYKAYY